MSTKARNPHEYVIEDILPRRQVHLVAGAPGIGKTTALVQMIEAWQKGEKWFGHQCHPLPFIYVSCDHNGESLARLIARMKVAWGPDQYFSAIDAGLIGKTIPFEQILGQALARRPDARVLFIDGFSSKVPGGKINDYDTVARFLAGLTLLCAERDLTIIGVVHTSKARQNDKYLDPRERVMGSNAWTAYADATILLERTHPGSKEEPRCFYRTIYLLPRNAPEQVFELDFRDGRLVERVPFLAAQLRDEFKDWLEHLIPGVPVKLDDIQKAFPKMSSRTVRRQIAIAVDLGRLIKARYGHYVRPAPDVLDDDIPDPEGTVN